QRVLRPARRRLLLRDRLVHHRSRRPRRQLARRARGARLHGRLPALRLARHPEGVAMTAVELLPPGTGPHDERWHELRRAGVTASEIAVVMGLSKLNSPFNLYWSKVNGWATEDNEIMAAGRHLEPTI